MYTYIHMYVYMYIFNIIIQPMITICVLVIPFRAFSGTHGTFDGLPGELRHGLWGNCS